MKAIVLLNSGAGAFVAEHGEPGVEAIAKALSAAGIDAEIRIVPGEHLAAGAKAAAASPVDVVIAGGGDGTINTVAGALAGTQMPLGILPLGTLNHFARDLGIPFDLKGAARVIAAQNIHRVDLGEVNGRIFINNSSLGIYARAVLERENFRNRHRLRKWTAMCMAVLKVFRRFPMVQVRIVSDTETILRTTPLVFVGNNRYQLDLLNVGRRARLDGGEMSLYLVNAQNRWGLLMVTLRALCGRLNQSRDFETFSLSSFSIASRRSRLHVAYDGEVMKAKPPLLYRIAPGALRVCLPRVTVEPDTVEPDTSAHAYNAQGGPVPGIADDGCAAPAFENRSESPG